MPTLRQLTVFTEVLRRGSVTEAADHLFVSQPAVSDTVRALEEDLGVKLFVGRGRNRRPSDAGQAYGVYANRILALVEEGQQALADLDGHPRGRLRLLAVPTAAEEIVPPVLRLYRDLYPDVEVSLRVTNRAGTAEPLRSASVDLAVMGRPPAGVAAEVQPFLENRLVLLCAPDHPAATEASRGVLTVSTWLIRESGSGTRAAVELALARRGIEITSIMELGSNAAVAAGLVQGLGLGVLPEIAAADEVAAGRLVVVDAEGFPLAREWHAVHPVGHRVSGPAKAFVDLLEMARVDAEGHFVVVDGLRGKVLASAKR